MFTFSQSTGILTNSSGEILGTGYSGSPAGKDNPADQEIPDIGPIPQGLYTIGLPVTSPHLGPVVMSLTPDLENQMFGRSGFFIHGDNPEHIGDSSEGCIILARDLRQIIADSGDNRLEVIA
jgi:hypothetical protein